MPLRTDLRNVREKLPDFCRALLVEIVFRNIYDFRQTSASDFAAGNAWLVNQEEFALRLTTDVLGCEPQAIDGKKRSVGSLIQELQRPEDLEEIVVIVGPNAQLWRYLDGILRG
jgi:hypothetical protein